MDKQGRTPEKGNRRSDSVVRAVMYAIVASILGSVAVTSSSGQVSVAVCLRVAALFVFCSAYFGDEWQSRGDAFLENCFCYDLIGWMLFAVQARIVNNPLWFSVAGWCALLLVSIPLTRSTQSIYHTHKADWLFENALWMTILVLLAVLRRAEVCMSAVLLLVSIAILIMKVFSWRELEDAMCVNGGQMNNAECSSTERGPCHGAYGTTFQSILIVLVGLLILVGTFCLLDRLVENVALTKSAVAVTDDAGFLKEGLTSWLTLFSILFTFFGFFVPVGAYLLQLKTLKDEKNEFRMEMQKALYAASEELSGKVERLQEELSKAVEEKAQRIWFAFSCGLEWQWRECFSSLVETNPAEVANIIIGFDHVIEAIARSGDGAKLCDFVRIAEPRLEQLMRSSNWSEVVALLSGAFHKDGRFLQGDAYRELLGGCTSSYKFLKQLFDQFAAWKFPE